ncbi:hypothetical protein BCR42DRAFT_405309 [Absidia repens]|uniref:Uncharacterized protein n=1 Tax=Absidia repens TaxID=90262 RepID=A0A1X2ITB0_9FUNG|nr:hypothetical protein BCR42DRAFT_405309 [Absidia repens]
MRTLIGVVVLAFWLGYLSASCGLFDVLVRVKEVLYIHCTIAAIYFIILIPLERIAEAENCKNPKSTFRTSAKEHLQRRGSF